VIEIRDQGCEARDLDIEVVLDAHGDGVLDGEGKLTV
jgi:hypothetical protein